MNIFKRLVTEKCPNCDNRFSKDAGYCNVCGYGNQKAWTQCQKCGSSVGAESNFCWNCHADLVSQDTQKTSGGVWRREFDDIAVRIPLQFPGEVLNQGVQVEQGTEGYLFINGVPEGGKLRGGYTEQRPDRSLLDRLFQIEGGDDRVEAVIVPSENFNVPVQVFRGIGLREGGEIQASAELTLSVEDILKVRSQLLIGRDSVTTADLENELLPHVSNALGNCVGNMSRESILEKRYDRAFFDGHIRQSLVNQLADKGLRYERLNDISVLGDFMEEEIAKETRERLRREGLEEQFQQLNDAQDLEQFRAKLQHEARLSDKQLQEIEMLFSLESKGKIRAKEKELELGEAEHSEDLKDIKIRRNLDRARDVSKFTDERMEEALRVKAKKGEIENALNHQREMNQANVRIHLATSFSGLDRDAILAASGKETRADLIKLTETENEALAAQIPPISKDFSFSGEPEGLKREPTKLELRREAVGILYAGVNADCLERLGTAWAVSHDKIVTNAHVALHAMGYIENGLRIWMKFAGAEVPPIQVAGMKIHPEFDEHLYKSDIGEHAIPGCDFAVGYLDGRSPSQLRCLTGGLLRTLRVGQSVSYLGFPSEGIPGQGSNTASPHPLYKTGYISALTDFSFADVGPSQAVLITHDLGVAGGSSGSPLMDDKGNVIGIVSAGTMHAIKSSDPQFDGEAFDKIPTERVPSGALVNFAQRIDLLNVLL